MSDNITYDSLHIQQLGQLYQLFENGQTRLIRKAPKQGRNPLLFTKYQQIDTSHQKKLISEYLSLPKSKQNKLKKCKQLQIPAREFKAELQNPTYFCELKNQTGLSFLFYSVWVVVFMLMFVNIVLVQRLQRKNLNPDQFEDTYKFPKSFLTFVSYFYYFVCLFLGIALFFVFLEFGFKRWMKSIINETTIKLWFGISFVFVICLFFIFIYSCILSSGDLFWTNLFLGITGYIVFIYISKKLYDKIYSPKI